MHSTASRLMYRVGGLGMPKQAAHLAQRSRRATRLAQRLPVWGLPPGAEDLAPILRSECGRRVHVAHMHLSSWKSTGAYRLFIHTTRGAMRTLVFKNEEYDAAANPALVDLPVIPGPPEFAVYRAASGALRDSVPEVLLCDELEPGRRYRYLLRDLMPDHRRPRGDDDHVLIAGRLAELHELMRSRWDGEPCRLLQYRDVSAEQFLRYFLAGLERYTRSRQGSSDAGGSAGTLLRNWHKVERLYSDTSYNDDSVFGPIHGDPNASNIHLHRTKPHSIRFVDWEWCGLHIGHADLASLLKSASRSAAASAVARYAEIRPQLKLREHERLYHWSSFERGLLDAAFLTHLSLDPATRACFDLRASIRGAAARALESATVLWRSTPSRPAPPATTPVAAPPSPGRDAGARAPGRSTPELSTPAATRPRIASGGRARRP